MLTILELFEFCYVIMFLFICEWVLVQAISNVVFCPYDLSKAANETNHSQTGWNLVWYKFIYVHLLRYKFIYIFY